MEHEIYQLLNCFYIPDSDNVQEIELQAKKNKEVANSIFLNLQELYDIKKKQ